jgi:hypothetical protein
MTLIFENLKEVYAEEIEKLKKQPVERRIKLIALSIHEAMILMTKEAGLSASQLVEVNGHVTSFTTILLHDAVKDQDFQDPDTGEVRKMEPPDVLRAIFMRSLREIRRFQEFQLAEIAVKMAEEILERAAKEKGTAS